MMNPPLHQPGLIALAASILVTSLAVADEGFSIILRHSEGARTVDYQYTSNATTTRLDRLGEATVPPTPWNLIDRATGAITILRPHNQSITKLPSDAFERRPSGEPDAAPMPPGVDLPPGVGPDPAQLPGGVKIPEGPNSSPGIPSAPAGVPGGGPPIGSDDFPDTDTSITELTAHEETRKIHGHTTTRHTLTLDHSLELELWLAESADLPPFYLLLWEGPPHFGHNDLLQDWPHHIRKAGMFPLLAILREAEQSDQFSEVETSEPETKSERHEFARWKVLSIDPVKPDDDLFAHPENFFNHDRT